MEQPLGLPHPLLVCHEYNTFPGTPEGMRQLPIPGLMRPSQCKQDPLLGLLNNGASSHRARHHPGQVHCQPGSAKKHAAQLHLTLKINTLSQNRCRQLGPEPSVAPIACRKLWEQREHAGGHLEVPGQAFRTSRAHSQSRGEEDTFQKRRGWCSKESPSQEPKSQFLSQLCNSEQTPLALGLSFL